MISDLFDKIYCINLESRKDRLKESLAEFVKHDIYNVEIFPAIDGRLIPLIPGCNAGHTGCIMSHLLILKEAQGQRYKNVLIFEDDVQFAADFNDKLKFIPDDYDMLYFGGSDKYAIINQQTEHIARIQGTLCTHAYAVNESIYQLLIDLLSNADAPIDVMYTRIHNQIKTLGFRPKIAWQRESFSNILNRNIRYKSATNEDNPNNEW